VALDISAHELANHLCGWFVVGLACNKKFIAQLVIDSDPHANVLLHRSKCNQWLHILEVDIASSWTACGEVIGCQITERGSGGAIGLLIGFSADALAQIQTA